MAFTRSNQPSWQVLPCPSWCTEEHREDDHEDDRRHGSHSYVPIIRVARARDGEGRLAYSFEPTELMIVSEAYDRGSTEPWLAVTETDVEGPAQVIRLSIESAIRLAGALLRDAAVLSSSSGEG